MVRSICTVTSRSEKEVIEHERETLGCKGARPAHQAARCTVKESKTSVDFVSSTATRHKVKLNETVSGCSRCEQRFSHANAQLDEFTSEIAILLIQAMTVGVLMCRLVLERLDYLIYCGF